LGKGGLKAERLLLHVGHPKTGTSSLQATLRKSHDALLGQSILHPLIGTRTGNNRTLIPYLLGPSEIEKKRLGRTRPNRQAAAAAQPLTTWNSFLAALDHARPDTVILSSEQFFRVIHPEQQAQYCAALRSVATEIEVIAYLRSPPSYFLSHMNQRLKFYRPTRIRSGAWLRPVIDSMIRHGPGRVSLNVFDRSVMTGGDIVQDFFARNLPDFDTTLLGAAERESNTTISTEAMALLQQSHSGGIGLSRNRHRASRAIRAADRAIPNPTRPDFRDGVRQIAIDRAADDLFWLRDTHGLVFPDIDYTQIRPLAGDDPMLRLTRIEDICPVNPERKAEVLALARSKAAWWRFI